MKRVRLSRVYVILLFAIGVLFSPAASAQLDNSCTYRFSWGTTQDDSYFSFCLTKYGTLTSLQPSSGSYNHSGAQEMLDQSNPTEGWGLSDYSDWSYFPNLYIVAPGLQQGELPTITQPNGAGKLPIIFDWQPLAGVWERHVRQTVTSVPAQRMVTFTMIIYPLYGTGWNKGTYGYGPFMRFAQLKPNNLDTILFWSSTFAASGYSYNSDPYNQGPNDGVLLTGTSTYKGTGITAQTYNAWGCANASGCASRGFTSGVNTVFSNGWFDSASSTKVVFTYKVF
jgi:hypothetical protein